MKRALFFAAFALSAGVHVVLAGLSNERTAAPPGGQIAGEVALGTSFADLAAGTMESTEPDGEIAPARPDEAKDAKPDPDQTETAPVDPDQTEEAKPEQTTPTEQELTETAPPEEAAASAAEMTESARPTQSPPISEPTVTETATPPTLEDQPSANAAPVETTPTAVSVVPVAPSAPAVDVAVAAPTSLSKFEPLAPMEAQPTALAPPETPTLTETTPPETETLAPSEARETLAVSESLRPKSRPTPQRQATPAPAPRQPQAAAPTRRGNSEANASRGQTQGSETGQQAESNNAQQTTSARVGQAQINSYASRVASRVARSAGRLRAQGNSGDVRVAIRISSTGSLAGASVVTSSSNPDADSIALQAVRRAAPFGAPPTGQGISFTVTVQVKGR